MLGSCQNMHAPSYVCVMDVKEKMIHNSYCNLKWPLDDHLDDLLQRIIIHHVVMNSVSGNVLQSLLAPPSDTTFSWPLVTCPR